MGMWHQKKGLFIVYLLAMFLIFPIIYAIGIDPSVVSQLNKQEEVKVMIKLKDEYPIEFSKIKNNEVKEQLFKERLKRIKKAQFNVLSGLTDDDFKVKYQYKSLFALAGKITKKGLAKLQNNPDIIIVYLPIQGQETLSESIPLINADDVWNLKVNGLNINGSGETICIIDSGVDYTHDNLGSCTQSEFLNGNCKKVISGWDFIDNDADPNDVTGHGTYVAGIAAANGNIKGVAPDAKIIAVKVVNSSGGWSEDDVVEGLEWCILNQTKYNISIVSMSLNAPKYGYFSSNQLCENIVNVEKPALVTAINDAHDDSILVVVSSGNEGNTNGITAPACFFKSTSVGATNNNDLISTFTNRATNLDLLAPGKDIKSLKSSTISCHSGCQCEGNYMTCDGTSASAPHVSGAAALLQQYNKLKYGVALTPDEIEDLLKNTGKDIQDINRYFPRIDVLAAINLLDTTLDVGDPKSGKVYKDSSWKVKLNINNISCSNLTVRLEPHTNDNIDLIVTSPSETKYTNYASGTEVVTVSSPQDGTWTIEVNGTSIINSDRFTNFDIYTGKTEADPACQVGGINFTSLNLNYISTCDTNKPLQFVLKGKEANATESVIDIENATNQALDAFMVGLVIPDNKIWISMDTKPGNSFLGRVGDVSRIDSMFRQTEVARIMLDADVKMKFDQFGSDAEQFQRDMLQDWKDNVTSSPYYSEMAAQKFNKFPTYYARTWIYPVKAEANGTGCKIFITNLTLGVDITIDYITLDLSPYGFRQEIINDLNYRLEGWKEKWLETHIANITSKTIDEINNDPEYTELRRVATSLAIAQWYKQQDRSKVLYGDLIDSNNISTLNLSFNQDYWEEQAWQYLYTLQNAPSFTGGSYTWTYYGGVLLTAAEPNVTGIINNATENIIGEALTTSYAKVNDTYYFGSIKEPSKPDLRAVGLMVSALSPYASETINITTVIQNNGEIGTSPFNIYFKDKYTYSNGYTTQTKIGEISNQNLTANEFKSLSILWNTSLLGQHDIIIEVDANNNIEELNELNNEKSRVITVVTPYPTATITSPYNNNQLYGTLTLTGQGTDLQDGYLADASLKWNSSIEGYLGGGSALSINLTEGSHIITLTVNDSNGYRDEDSIILTILSPLQPAVRMISPVQGQQFAEGENIYFSGQAYDPQDGELTGSSLQWNSSLDGFLSYGKSFIKSTLTVGSYNILLKATDTGGLFATIQRSISVLEGTPTASISSPTNGQGFFKEQNITFTGSGTDPQDGTLTNLVWSSNIDGAIGTGTTFTKKLSSGTHTITFTVIDSHGLTATATRTITVYRPGYSIISTYSPKNEQQFTNGALIDFIGSAEDAYGQLPNSSLNWSSNLDGYLASGSPLIINSTTLTLGEHEITFIVTSSGGLTNSLKFNITINSALPTADIISPPQNQIFSQGQSIILNGTGIDLEDGTLSNASLNWTSSKDGFLGFGSPFSANLSVGTHIITLKVNDSNSKTNTESVDVIVVAAGSSLINTLSDDSYSKNLTYNLSGEKVVYVTIPVNANITYATIDVTGYST